MRPIEAEIEGEVVAIGSRADKSECDGSASPDSENGALNRSGQPPAGSARGAGGRGRGFGGDGRWAIYMRPRARAIVCARARNRKVQESPCLTGFPAPIL